MTTENTPPTPASPEDIVHWAQWFTITYWRLLATPAGTNERRKAYVLHTKAGESVIHSTGITESEARNG